MNPVYEIPKHHLERERIPHFRPYGFDYMENTVDFIKAELAKHKNKSFVENYQSGQRYLFIKAEKPNGNDVTDVSRFQVEIDVGYIDFQTTEKVSLIRLNAIYYNELIDITLISAYQDGKATTEIDYVLDVLANGSYFKLANEVK